MPTRKANAEWKGGLKDGGGTLALGSGAFEGPYSFGSRFEDGAGTNPEELLGAAHAACFSMALSVALEAAGFTADSVATHARVHLEKTDGGFAISGIHLDCKARVPKIDEDTFHEHAEGAKKNCPISKALAATEIRLTAELLS